MKKALLLVLSLVIISMAGFTQTGKYWFSHTDMGSKIATDKAVARQSFPKSFKLFDLNISSLRQDLFSIVGNQSSRRSTVISLPNADGQIEQFEVYEASNFEPALQAQFPEIRAYSGKGLTDKVATLKLSISPEGIQTMIFRTERDNEFIEPYSKDHSIYAIFKSQRNKSQIGWTCSTPDEQLETSLNALVGITHRPESSAGELKTMRLAQSVTAEYSNFFGATSVAQVGLVVAAVNATMTRSNGVYEKDLALHLNLIANTTDVYYYDPSTDPYSPGATGAGGAWNGELQATLTSVIGDANYDIGHLFGASGGGGNAGCIGCVCSAGIKGRGFTSPADNIPQGDNFDIDYVVHEIGHQLGGNHTFSQNNEGSGVNKEVGSGITIMGYAGITNQDVAPHSIDIFHQASIQQIQNNLATKTCPITTNITANNATPVVAAVSSRTIPLSTPFTLTGFATDANAGDVLTYCWEQNDNSTTTGNASVASPTKLTGPNWLSFSPTTNPTRTLPILATILAGNFITGPLPGGDAIANIEALSSVARNLNFRLTVRDNAPYVSSGAGIKVGQTAFTDVVITVDGTSGPFQVTAPNTAVSYFAGSTQNITWSVNNTTAPPVSCSNVKISISTDGGLTFPTVLAASTANDGTEALTIPATLTTTARIKVEAIGNIFFDISNANFIITTPPTDFNFGSTTATTSACPAAATLAVTIPTTQTGGFANPITLATTSGVPVGATVSFGTNPVTPGSSSIATLNNANTLNAGTYVIGVSGTATGASVKNTTITFIITAGAGPVLTINSAATTVCAPATATFTVATAAALVTYQWQSAPTIGGTYNNIPTATAASYTTAATSAGMNGMGFRCVVSTQCGTTTSANALLTVNTVAAIVIQPVSTTACTGGTATFTTVATGTGVTYQWQSGTSAAGPWTNVGTNSTSYTTAPLTVTTPTFYQVVTTTTTCPATVTSNVVTLGVSVTTAIGTQPTAQTVCVGSTATYTVAATGTSVVYQWQSGTSATGPWTNVGANSNSYTTAATTAGMNGMFFQVVVTGTCNAVTSIPMMLTVNTFAAITTQPTAITLCNGVAATFTAAGSGTGVTYQWQSAPAATGPWVNVTGGTGATTTSYTTALTTPAMNGTYYRMVATTTTCALVANSNAALLTVNTVAVIGTQPAAQSACIPQTALFNVAATGTGLTYQWQVALAATPTVFTDITGATGASYTTVPSVLTMNGNLYRVNILSTCSPTTPTTSTAVLLTVTNPVAITLQPASQSGCATDNYTFTATASSPGNTITYQWQASNTGAPGTFNNIAGANGTASATANISYVINNAPQYLNGTFYRVYFSVPCGTGISADTSRAGKLTLSLRPTVILTAAATSNLNPAVNSAITTTVSPATGNFIYSWKKNGTVIPNTLATTSITIPVDDNNKYDVTITDPSTGCVSLVSTLTTSALTSDNLALNKVFIYPNPVSNIMYVRFNTSTLTARGTRLSIYDEKAARVFTADYSIVGTNGRMQVDMSKYALGTYIVYIMDANGKKLASSKVVKVQ